MFRDDRDIQNQKQDQIIIPTKNGYVTIPAPEVRGQKKASRSKSIKSAYWLTSHFKNNLQFIMMLAGMITMLGFMGYTITGITGVISVLVIGGLGFLVNWKWIRRLEHLQ